MERRPLALRGVIQALGPGLLLAATATGVSHLVQSTRAGATYGFGLVGVILLANLLKYPFFFFGPRYAAATGESLVDGYRRLGRSYFVLFLLLTLGTMFAIQAAVTSVTAGVASLFLPWDWSPVSVGVGLLILCAVILGVGRYSALDQLIKVVIVILVVTTGAASLLAWMSPVVTDPSFVAPELWAPSGIAFVIALMGWMPAPLDVAVWNSLWTLARQRQTRHQPTLGEEDVDFNIGYIGCGILALCFLSLGANVMYGSGVELSHTSVGFAQQLAELYTASLGSWTWPVIVVTALTTMFSTTLTALDAYARVCRRIYLITAGQGRDSLAANRAYWVCMLLMVVGTSLVLTKFGGAMLSLVDVATTLSFLSAPILAWMNYHLITRPHVPAEARPGWAMRLLSYFGLAFLTLFTLLYLWWKF